MAAFSALRAAGLALAHRFAGKLRFLDGIPLRARRLVFDGCTVYRSY